MTGLVHRTSNSFTMAVYVICTLSAVLCIPEGEARENTLSCTKGTNHIHPRSHGTADLYHSAR